jgi:hypothetical protein
MCFASIVAWADTDIFRLKLPQQTYVRDPVTTGLVLGQIRGLVAGCMALHASPLLD